MVSDEANKHFETKNGIYHGILLDLEFEDSTFINSFNIFAKRKSTSNPWTLYGVEVSALKLEEVLLGIQLAMKSDKPYYAHFYNDSGLIVVFKNKIIRVTCHKSTWEPIIEFGKTLHIPEEQLDFWPNRFQDEIHYFSKQDFVVGTV